MKFYITKKKYKKINKLQRIEEDKIFIETDNNKYNSCNQINILDKIYEYYVLFIKFIINYKN